MTIPISDIEKNVADVLMRNLELPPENGIDEAADLFDQGLDSMSIIPVILELEEMFGLEFDLPDFADPRFRTIRGISESVRLRLSD